ncbi:MAG: type IV pilin [Methanomicrobiales archaeon]|nr:type IV pilin [Methanomicrobiales archaeon]
MSVRNDTAVSPVVGVMLMLVVVIIIAAVVSAFAGGTVSGVKKAPQATITGKYSLSNGLEIIHSGGDGLVAEDTVFVIRDGPMFGKNLEQKTVQVLNRSLIVNGKGQYLLNPSGVAEFSSFMAGESLFIDGANTTCSLFQPAVYATNGYQKYCINDPENIAKTFYLEVSDTTGNLISRSEIVITG